MSWQEVNRRIEECRQSPDPLACLTKLFHETRDGHVAMALGVEYERSGFLHDASRLFRQAAQIYPRSAFQEKARRAAREVETRLVSRPASSLGAAEPRGGNELHIIECSRTKIWDERGDVPRFVPARAAYLGSSIQSWLRDPRSKTDRWLVLSARYGFIDPDQPVEDYDVTFRDPTTGPISVDALAGQVRHQVRWHDRVPLRTFGRVVVHGHQAYVSATRAAFLGLGATVVEGPANAGNQSTRHGGTTNDLAEVPELKCSRLRAASIATALGTVPIDAFTSLDQREPEWPVLTQLASWKNQELATLIAICLGFSDYQLGHGGAVAYWTAIGQELPRVRIGSVDDAVQLHVRLFRHPVAKRLAAQKLGRVTKVAALWLSRPRLMSARQTWNWLAGTLAQRPDAKTVVMAMKVLDLLNLARTGRYLDFGHDVPLPVDLRIARVSLTSGLIAASDGRPSASLLSSVELIASSQRDAVLAAWRAVGAAAGVSLLRIDSLLWQLGELVNRPDARPAMCRRLEEAGCPPAAAEAVCRELTVAVLP